MPANKVVIRCKDGTVLKGTTNDFFPNKRDFHLADDNGTISTVTMEDLKAVFFVKDYEGDSTRKDEYNSEITGAGRKIHIAFKDGEEITGYCAGYTSDRQGFFVVPADTEGNNDRIFVIASATQKVSFI